MKLSELPAFTRSIDTNLSHKINHLLGRISVGPIGFDLGRKRAHAVQLQYRNGVASIRAAASKKYPSNREDIMADPKQLRLFIQQLLSEHNFSGRDIVTCIAPDQLRLSSYDYNISDGRSDDEHILQLIKQDNNEPQEQLIIDYIPSRRSDHKSGERTAMVAVANKAEQIKYLELLRYAGLHVLGLEIGPIAIRRLTKSISMNQATPNILVINSGTLKTYFTVISGRRLLLDRGINFGQDAVLSCLANALELSESQVQKLLYIHGLGSTNINRDVVKGMICSNDIRDSIDEILKPKFLQLVQEIEKVNSYVHGQLQGADIQRIFLLGSFAHWPGIAQFLENLLDRKVEILNPFAGFSETTPENITAEVNAVSDMALATGCALSEVGSHV